MCEAGRGGWRRYGANLDVRLLQHSRERAASGRGVWSVATYSGGSSLKSHLSTFNSGVRGIVCGAGEWVEGLGVMCVCV